MKQQFCLYTVGLTLALSSIPPAMSQTPPQSSIPTLATNLPNVRAFVAPPATFNPLVASAEALQQFGFSPKPDQLKAPAAYNAWAKAVSAPQTRLQSPQLEQAQIANGPARIQPSKGSKEPASEFNATPATAVAATSSNWGAYVDLDNLTNPYLVNITTQQAVSITFNAPGGTTLVGNSAEWVVERPGISTGLAPLTNYVACPFDACYAFGSVNGGDVQQVIRPGDQPCWHDGLCGLHA